MVYFVLIIATIFLLVLVFKHLGSCRLLKEAFCRSNVIIFGKIGRGKDLLTQKVINLRKKEYYSNVDYGGKFNLANASMLDLGENTYVNFINNNIKILDKGKKPYEKKDFYFSDCGVILPSQYDTLLHKQFKGFPISYALCRHLWNNHIHVNTQNLERVWKALREQGDFYIKCNRTYKLPFGILMISFTCYDKYASAQQELTPMPNRLWNNLSKIERDKYVATNGRVEKHIIFIRKKHIHYDSRAYHKFIFGMTAKEYLKSNA